MTFEQVLKMAIEAYAQLDGRSVKEIAEECKDFTSQTAKNVFLLISATRCAGWHPSVWASYATRSQSKSQNFPARRRKFCRATLTQFLPWQWPDT